MEYKIVVHHLASEDILEIARWYDYQLAGLGNKFESDLEQAILKLTQNPFAFKALNKNIRRIYLIRFPYLVFYEVVQNDVHIYGVMHSRRNPQTMKKRFKNIRLKP